MLINIKKVMQHFSHLNIFSQSHFKKHFLEKSAVLENMRQTSSPYSKPFKIQNMLRITISLSLYVFIVVF